MEEKIEYIFHDLQTNGYSAHTTLKGLFDMLIEDDLIEEQIRNGELEENEELYKRIIENFEYEILEPTEENIKAYEDYHFNY